MHLSGSHVARFVIAALFSMFLIVAHECAHYLVAWALGIGREFHFARVHIPPGEFTAPLQVLLVVAAGPLVDVAFAAGGFVWLARLRRFRPQAVVSSAGWVATLCALATLRWLRCFFGTVTGPQPDDEAKLSGFLFLPPWVLPYALGIAAIFLLVVLIRNHPRGGRWRWFGPVVGGMIAGRFLWMNWLGPWLLP